MNDVKVLTKAGSYMTLAEYQQKYGLSPEKIGRYFSLREQRFQDDLTLYKELVVCEPLMVVLDKLRERCGHSLHINSYNRNQAKQNALKKAGYRAATTSPHVYKMAADVDTKTVAESRQLAEMAIEVAKELGIPIRVGVEDYIQKGQTFIHIDVCPVYFGDGKPLDNVNHPAAWEKAYSTW